MSTLLLPALAVVRPAACDDEDELALRARRDSDSPRNLTFASGALSRQNSIDASRARRAEASSRFQAASTSFGCGFDDFQSSGTRSKAGRSTGRHTRFPPRPTQRQPIDDETSIPPELFDQMLRLGGEARKRATHTLAFAAPEGTRYLRHSDAASILASETDTESTAAPSSPEQAPSSAPSSPERLPSCPEHTPELSPLPCQPRPASSCASELAMDSGSALDTIEGSAFILGVY